MKRVILVSSCDGLAALSCANLFNQNEDFKIVGLIQTKVSSKTKKKLMKKALSSGAIFYLIYMFFEQNLTTFIFKVFSIRNKRPASIADFSKILNEQKISMLETYDVNSPNSIQFANELNPDLILSIRPSQIFRLPFINACPPILNLHCSLLPNYRGIGGILQPLAAGENYLGCTVHQVDSEEIDRGPIWAQVPHKTCPGESVFYHTFLLFYQARSVIEEAIRNFSFDKKPKPNENGSLFSWPDRSVLKQLRKNKGTMINFSDIFKLFEFL